MPVQCPAGLPKNRYNRTPIDPPGVRPEVFAVGHPGEGRPRRNRITPPQSACKREGAKTSARAPSWRYFF